MVVSQNSFITLTLQLRACESRMVSCYVVGLDRFLYSVVCPLGIYYPQNYYPQRPARGVFELAVCFHLMTKQVMVFLISNTFSLFFLLFNKGLKQASRITLLKIQ